MFEHMEIVWMALAVVFAIVEAATFGLTAIWFAAGSLVAMIAALLGLPELIQIILFLAVSCVVIFFTRDWAKRHVNDKREHTNADRTVGMEGMVTQQIDNEKAEGLVRIAGQIWTARSVDGGVIPEGAHVRVQAIAGVKAMVEYLKEE